MRDGSGSCAISAPVQYQFRVHKAEVLATEVTGQPAFCVSKLGQGQVYLLTAPLEAAISTEAQRFGANDSPHYWQLYRTFAGRILKNRILKKNDPCLGITEHKLHSGDFLAVLINYSPEARNDLISISDQFAFSKVEMGDHEPQSCGPGKLEIHLPPHACSVWRLTAVN
jgi:hypothetical protein